jgi:hypothetical protein
MTRDNAILLIRLRTLRRHVWIAIHVQDHEQFADPRWLERWLWWHPVRYTARRTTALRIARTMARRIERLEHGIIQLFSKAKVFARRGEIMVISPISESFVWQNMTRNSDWKKISL